MILIISLKEILFHFTKNCYNKSNIFKKKIFKKLLNLLNYKCFLYLDKKSPDLFLRSFKNFFKHI